MKKEDYAWISVNDWCPDNIFHIGKLIELLQNMQKKYGKNTLIDLDAGYNNIILLIRPSKKIKLEPKPPPTEFPPI